jgi:hypothetical protein
MLASMVLWGFCLMFPIAFFLVHLKMKMDCEKYKQDFQRARPPIPPHDDPPLDRLETLNDRHPL